MDMLTLALSSFSVGMSIAIWLLRAP